MVIRARRRLLTGRRSLEKEIHLRELQPKAFYFTPAPVVLVVGGDGGFSLSCMENVIMAAVNSKPGCGLVAAHAPSVKRATDVVHTPANSIP